MVPGDASRIVDTDPGELGAYLYIIGVKTAANFAENSLFWLLIWVKMSLIAKRNILPEAPKIPRPIFLRIPRVPSDFF